MDMHGYTLVYIYILSIYIYIYKRGRGQGHIFDTLAPPLGPQGSWGAFGGIKNSVEKTVSKSDHKLQKEVQDVHKSVKSVKQ